MSSLGLLVPKRTDPVARPGGVGSPWLGEWSTHGKILSVKPEMLVVQSVLGPPESTVEGHGLSRCCLGVPISRAPGPAPGRILGRLRGTSGWPHPASPLALPPGRFFLKNHWKPTFLLRTSSSRTMGTTSAVRASVPQVTAKPGRHCDVNCRSLVIPILLGEERSSSVTSPSYG